MSRAKWARRIAASVGLAGLLVASAGTASAQSVTAGQDRYPRFTGHVFAAPVVRYASYCLDYDASIVCRQRGWSRQEALPQFGAAAEWHLTRSIGLAAEGGAVVSNGHAGGILSVNGTYYFRQGRGVRPSWAPFVTGGYSIDPDRSHGANLGAGLNIRTTRRTGIRVEARSSFWEYNRTAEFRIGLTFDR